MDFSYSEMMVVIQGLRIMNGMDENYTSTDEQKAIATNLLGKIDDSAEEMIPCTICDTLIPLYDCVEVQAGMLSHESDNGYIHFI